MKLSMENRGNHNDVAMENVSIQLNRPEDQQLLQMLNCGNNRKNRKKIKNSHKVIACILKKTVNNFRRKLNESHKNTITFKFSKGKIVMDFDDKSDEELPFNITLLKKNSKKINKTQKIFYTEILAIKINFMDNDGLPITTYKNVDDKKFLWIEKSETKKLTNKRKLIQSLSDRDFKFIFNHVFDIEKKPKNFSRIPIIIQEINRLQVIHKINDMIILFKQFI
jgi:hypothetical protein